MSLMFNKKSMYASLLFSLAIFGAACGGGGDDDASPDNGVLDDEGASFGATGKADSKFSACELREVLEFVNESDTTIDRLKNEAGVHGSAAKEIVAHRIGPDGVEGTGDDDLFETLEELDEVRYVGPKALEAFAFFVKDRCVIDLQSRPYIDSKTFEGQPNAGGFNRDDVELEATMNLTGVKGRLLNELMNKKDDRDRRGFQKVRRSKVMEAFSFNFPLDEIPWSSSAHEAREQLPYTNYSIESGRFEPDPNDGERELTLGTDYMFDRYYDTPDYTLLQNGIQLRGRIRWDTGDVVRRLLIAAKFDSEVGADGLKRAAKMDVRVEGNTYLATLDDDVRSGTVAWSGRRAPVAPIRALYDELVMRGVLPNVQGHDNVLLLDPKTFVRSERSRYHLDETSGSAVSTVHVNGKKRVEVILGYADEALASGHLDATQTMALEELKKLGAALLDDSAVRERARTKLMGSSVDADTLDLPAGFGSVRDLDHLEALHTMAEASSEVYHEFAELADELDRDITQTSGLDHDEYVDMFIAWQKNASSGLRAKQIAQPFLDKWDAIAAQDAATRQVDLDKFNDFGKMMQDGGDKDFKDFAPMTEEIFANLGKHLRFEVLKVSQRQIAAAGTMSYALWFDVARRFHFGQGRGYGNFIIDTLDLTEMVTPEMWATMTDDQKKPELAIPPEKVFHTVFVNEVQIELTMVGTYLEKIKALEKRAADGEDVQRELDSAKAIFKHFTDSLVVLSELKGDDIKDEIRDLDGPKDVDWVPAEYSKGTTALKILSEGIN